MAEVEALAAPQEIWENMRLSLPKLEASAQRAALQCFPADYRLDYKVLFPRNHFVAFSFSLVLAHSRDGLAHTIFFFFFHHLLPSSPLPLISLSTSILKSSFATPPHSPTSLRTL